QHAPESSDLVAEVPFHFENESAGPMGLGLRAIRKDLFRKWVHTAAGLATADRPKNRGAGVKPAFWDCEPVRFVHRLLSLRVVDLADHQEEFPPSCRRRIRGESLRA